MNKLIALSLTITMMLSTSLTSAFATTDNSKTVIYKLTPKTGYTQTIGRFVSFKALKNLNELSRGDYKNMEGTQDYIAVDNKTKLIGHGVNVQKVDLNALKKIKTPLAGGTYLIGEIEPGKYKLDGDGVALILTGVPSDINAAIKSFEVVDGTAYITVAKDDFALKLIGDVTATKIK